MSNSTMPETVRTPPYWIIDTLDGPSAMADPWHISQFGLRQIQQEFDGGADQIIAIIDTGAPPEDHPEFAGRMLQSKTFVRRSRGDSLDYNGHGTASGSMAAGRTNGVAPNAKVMFIQGLATNGSGRSDQLADCIRYAVEHGATVINGSFGAAMDDPYMPRAIEYAKSQNVPCIFASGNEHNNRVSFPSHHAVSVGAVNRALTHASFSNTGAKLDLVAPGESVRVALPDHTYQVWSGTSFACPHVAGSLALLNSGEKKVFGEVRTNTDRALLERETYVVDRGPDGPDPTYGRGLIDYERLFYEYLRTDQPPPVQTPEPLVITVMGKTTGQMYERVVVKPEGS